MGLCKVRMLRGMHGQMGRSPEKASLVPMFSRGTKRIRGLVAPKAICAPESQNPAAALSKKLRAAAQEGSRMQHSQGWRPGSSPKELLVWVCVERLKKLEIDVLRWWQSKRCTHPSRMEICKSTGWLLSFSVFHPCCQPVEWCHLHQGGSNSLPTHRAIIPRHSSSTPRDLPH